MTNYLSLYIHFPWCLRKCPYCDFNSFQISDHALIDEYINKLVFDLQITIPGIYDRTINTIFFGGGTPSLIPAELIEKILINVNKNASLASNLEVTLEVNPGTITTSYARSLKAYGVNRLSLGIQSFQNQMLRKLGRIHNSNQAIVAIDAAKNAGFDNLNLDLMFGLPSQTLTDALSDLATAIQFEPTHLSWYQLTIEPDSYFHRFPPKLPSTDYIANIYEHGTQLLSTSGFNQYEISAYCRNNHYCIHNLNYWQFGDYLGIGAGAHGKVTNHNKQIIRYQKIASPQNYLASTPPFIDHSTVISKEEVIAEFMLNVLRLSQEIPFALFEERTGLAIDTVQAQLAAAAQQELLEITPTGFKTTELGKTFLNNLIAIFFP